ncbi:MAG: GIY-YIG nuclease family protein [Alphaproteobacteria bacterium]|nr:GIY-YIG nuclease family protein [Alphaproteobacteria bacterium]
MQHERGPALKREHILEEIRRVAAANGGRAPGRQTFENETGIREGQWRGVYWARWGDALVEAGFSANEKISRLDQDTVMRKLSEAARHYRKFPTSAELRMYRKVDPDFLNENTFYSRFKGAALLENLRAWCSERPDYADVLSLLPGEAAPTINRAHPSVEGLVYLIRSGAFYKIGRSEELERRVKEIKVSLPDAATLAHTIRTDDPAGIEAYWHRRFADRRANGEWFKLAPADVAAFKRRKYQ